MKAAPNPNYGDQHMRQKAKDKSKARVRGSIRKGGQIPIAGHWLSIRMVVWAGSRAVLAGLAVYIAIGRLNDADGSITSFARLMYYPAVVLLLAAAGLSLGSGSRRWHELSNIVGAGERIRVQTNVRFAGTYEYGAYMLIWKACLFAVTITQPKAPVSSGETAEGRRADGSSLQQRTIRAWRWVNAGASLKRQIRVSSPHGGPDLEWRVLRWQRQVTGTVIIRGEFRPGSWLIAELPDGGLIWPASRSQPVLGSSKRLPPVNHIGGQDVVCTTGMLLAAYALLLKQSDRLPVLVRCPPGSAPNLPWQRWWWIGAPRTIVAALTTSHITRRLHLVSDALTREAMLACGDGQQDRRTALSIASQECRNLASTAHHPIKLAVASLAGIGSVALAYYSFLFSSLHVQLSRFAMVVILGALYTFSVFFGFVPILIALRSIRCTRVMIGSASNTEGAKPYPNRGATGEMTVGALEYELFRLLGIRLPWDWTARSWMSWLIAIGYCSVLYVSVFTVVWGAGEGLRQLWQYLPIVAVLALLLVVVRGAFINKLLRADDENGEPIPRPHLRA